MSTRWKEEIGNKDAIIVALCEQEDVKQHETIIKEGWIDKVQVSGDGGRNHGWVIRLENANKKESGYYSVPDQSKFRLATIEEISEYNSKGAHILILSFKPGMLVKTKNKLTYTTKKEDKIKGVGYTDTVEDSTRTKSGEKVFWFKGHKGVFREEDFERV